MKKSENFSIELQCGHAEWWRMQVVMIARTLTSDETAGFYSAEDLPEELSSTGRTTRLECTTGNKLELYLYIIPHSLPSENDIYEVPTLPATLTIRRGKEPLLRETLEVNPWGGLSRIIRLGGEPSK